MKRLYCLWCGDALTGKQRKFCCDAHRTRFNRAQKSTAGFAVTETGDRPRIDRESTGNRRTLYFEIVMEVEIVTDWLPGEWDKSWVNRPVRMKIAKGIAQILRELHPGMEIRVRIRPP